MRALLAIIILICLCFGACSSTKHELETPHEAAEITATLSQASLTQTPAVAPSATSTPIPSPSPTPFERKDVMDSPKIMIRKSERMLYVYDGDELCAKIDIVLGSTPEGHKQIEGDGKTPEGSYYICSRNAQSKFYLSLGISYPNKQDAESGLERDIISKSEYDEISSAIDAGKRPPWDTKLGGEIMIHAGGVSSDWTAGCIAALEEDIDYLWENCPIGTPIDILP